MTRGLFATMFVLFAAVVAFGQTRFELKGDHIGESISEFKARHRGVSCSETTDVLLSCSDRNASFAGHDPLQNGPLGALVGMSAIFFEGRLDEVMYVVYGELDSIDAGDAPDIIGNNINIISEEIVSPENS